MKRWMLVFVAALTPVAPLISQQSLPVITLQQSIDATLANGDDNKILRGNLDIARAQHALNVSRNSLSLGASAGYAGDWGFGSSSLLGSVTNPLTSAPGPTAGVSVSGPLTAISVGVSPYIPPLSGSVSTTVGAAAGVSATQTLWNGYPGGPAQATVDKSVLSLQGKELATEAGRLGLVYSVKQAFYTLLAAQRALGVRKQISEKQDSVLKQIEAIYELRSASLADLKTAQVNARSAQADVDSAENDLRFARIALATFMGRPADDEFTAAEAPDPSLPVSTAEEAVARGLRQRVEIKQI
jgi:outer membrane protein TolC